MSATYVTTGQPFSFAVNLEPAADVGSVTWTVRDGAGNPMNGATNIAVETPDNANSVVIPTTAVVNSMAPGSTAESRFLVVQWTVGGATYSVTVPYILIAWMPIRVQPQDVLAMLGTNVAELTPDDVDIPSAALFVQADISPATFQSALTAGDQTTLRVNQLIALKAGTELAPSIPLRLAAMMKSDTSSFQRMKLEVTKYIDYLWDNYTRIRNDLLGPQQQVTQTVMAIGAPGSRVFLEGWGGMGGLGGSFGPRYQMGFGPLFGGNLLPLIMSPGLGNSF